MWGTKLATNASECEAQGSYDLAVEHQRIW